MHLRQQNEPQVKAWHPSQYRLYNPYSFQPSRSPLQTPMIGGGFTPPVTLTSTGMPYYRAPQTYRGATPRVTVGQNMAFRPSPYASPAYSPQAPQQPPLSGTLNQLMSFAQNMGIAPQTLQTYLRARGGDPYSINLADFLQWWQRFQDLGSPYGSPTQTPSMGGV